MYTKSIAGGIRASPCDIAEIAKSESGWNVREGGREDETFQMSQLCVCLALSVPASREPLFADTGKPRILAKLSAEMNSTDYPAFSGARDFSLPPSSSS